MDDLVKDLEDEIMLAAFYGYRLPALEKRLEELYSQRDFDPLLRGKAGKSHTALEGEKT